MEMSDEEALLQIIESQLALFPHLKSALPKNYPRAPKYEINPQKMAWYRDNRESTNWNHFNLPFALFNLWHSGQLNGDSKVNGLTTSILKALDDFAKEFSTLPGFRTTIEPLWTSAWDIKDPRMWSVPFNP